VTIPINVNREYYTKNLLKQPTISHVVRYILSKWTK